MTESSLIGTAGANSGVRRNLGGTTPIVRPIAAIIAKARGLWRNKVAVELSARAGVSVRTAENYLAGQHDMSGNALARLIQSDEGPAFIQALIADLPPSRQEAWRKEFSKAAERAALLRKLQELEQD